MSSRISRRTQELTLRMLGENITLTRWQWDELLESLEPTSELAARVRRLLEQS